MPQAGTSRKPTFKRFNDLLPEDVDFDFHMHTDQTDGKHSAAEMISRARELGLTAIAITDHVNRDCPWYQGFGRRIEALRQSEAFMVYLGMEAKALDFEGTLDASDDVLDSAELVVGSVHRYPDGKGGLIPLSDIPSLGAGRAAEIELGLALGLVSNRRNRVDVLGHPFGVFSKFFETVPPEPLEALMRACAESEVAFEISTRYCRDLRGLVELLHRVNPPVSIGSDAHSTSDIARQFPVLKDEISRWR
jgi:putative hydrolase